jgi:predicted exporter
MRKFYLKSLLLLRAKRRLALVLVSVLTLACVLILAGSSFDNDVAEMLPENSAARKTLRFINESKLANRIIISLRLNDPSHSLNDLCQQVEALAAGLKLPGVDKIDYKLTAASPLNELRKLTPCLPQIMGNEARIKLEKILYSSGMKKLVDSLYQRLSSPVGMGQSELISSDPFDLKLPLLKKLQSFQNIWGIKTAPGQNYFISRDLRSAMLIIHTQVTGTNTVQSRELIAGIKKILEKKLPSWVSADIIAGHLRALSNEKVIKKDIAFTLTLSFIGFLLLFALFYRYDLRCLLILLTPVLATVFVLAAMTFVFDKTLLFVAGLGGVIVGIAVDYGIHIYSAMASGRHFRGAARVIRPLTAGGLTTFGVFAVFMFSDTPGYRQLGVFAGCSIILSLLMAEFFLPVIFVKAKIPAFTTGKLHGLSEHLKKYPRIIFICWLTLTAASIYFVSQISLADDLRQLDASGEEIEQAEERFRETWGNRDRPAILVISGKNREEAAQRAASSCAILRFKADVEVFCATDIWPSEQVRYDNVKSLRCFELNELEKTLNRQATVKGFADDAFSPFFAAFRAGIEEPEKQKLPEMFQSLIDQTVNSRPGAYSFFIFFRDEPELVRMVRGLSGKSVVVSGNAFRQMLSEAVLGKIFKLVCFALLIVVLITFLLTRRLSRTILALLPVASALLVTGAFFELFAIPVNAAACIGAVVVIGLAIDYGIFMADGLGRKHRGSVLPAITLSSLTTLIGAGAVIFAVHPMLRSVGIVLCVGIFTAWLTSVAVIPALWKLFCKNKAPAALLLIFLAAFALTGCSGPDPFKRRALPLLPQETPEKQLAAFKERQSESFTALSGIVFTWGSRKISSLCLVEVGHQTRQIKLAGMNLMGVKLFEAAGDARQAKLLYSALNLKLKRSDDFADAMIRDISKIYFDNIPQEPYSVERGEKEIIFTVSPDKSQFLKYYFGGSPLVLLKKQAFNDNILCWQVTYYRYKKVGKRLIPYEIFYRNEKYDYYLEVRQKEITPKEP